ncbi:MAG: glycosyltransferase family 2 protein [Acidobacteriota bacterium]
MKTSVAVLIPCYNEEMTITKVVEDFQRQLPEAKIFVYDNNSSDRTVQNAVACGAEVKYESKQGKGNVVRTMFRDISADVYVMVDGDATYPADKVHALLEPVLAGKADMTVGTRLDEFEEKSFRFFHKFGNELIRKCINLLFGTDLRDILSGYRCFSSRFAKSVPILSKGFEVETELTLQALDKKFTIIEIPVDYYSRPEGSHSKLNTYLDGMLVLKTIFWIFKDYRPLKFFSLVGLLSVIAGFALGSIPVLEFIHTRKVTHPSTAVLSTGFVLIALLSFATGFILDTINRRYKEQYQLLADHIIHRMNNNAG